MKLLRFLILALALSLPGWAVGVVNTNISQISASPNQVGYLITFTWTGDASTGSVPVTAASGQSSSIQQALLLALQGTRVISVETSPGTPSPTNGYSVQVLDNAGVDVLGGSAAAASSTVAQSWSIATTAPPINGTLSLSITGQSVASAKGTVYVFVAPVLLSGNGTSGGGGSGSVISFTVAGTTNKISVSGTCTVTSVGTCTITIPDAVVLVGPALGTPISGVMTNVTGLTESGLSFTDITTRNATTSLHGLLPKLDNNSAHFLNGQGGWATPAGGGTVTVVASGSLTSTACVTGGGTTTLQTPNATCTIDSSGNISTSGTIAVGAGGSSAGAIDLGQGTAVSLATTSITIMAPASVTSYGLKYPGAAPAANQFMLWGSPSSSISTALFTTFISTNLTDTASISRIICSGTVALGTSAISSGAAATTVTAACTGLLSTDNIQLDFNSSPLAVTGYVPSADGTLMIYKWPSTDTINISVVNNTANSITPGARTLNFRVTR